VDIKVERSCGAGWVGGGCEVVVGAGLECGSVDELGLANGSERNGDISVRFLISGVDAV
jgi:hypothetical protein